MAKTRKNFKKHMMYSKSGEGRMAKTYEEHLDLKNKGWGHTKPKRKLKGLHAAKYFIGGLISGIKGAKQSKKDIAKAEADRQAQMAKEEELKKNRQKLTMSPEIEKMKEGLGGGEINRRQEAAERARAGAMAAATRGGSRVDPFAAARAGEAQEGKLATEQAAAQRAGLKSAVAERGKLRTIQEDRQKADQARQAQLTDYAREDVMSAQSNLASYQQQQYGAIDAGIGTLASALSDKKEKRNIRKVGRTKGGVPVSEFEYKDKEDAPKGPGRYRGVIAQDLVGTKHEGAVRKVGKNTLGVNYGKLDIKLGKIGGGRLKDKIRKMKGGGIMDSGEVYKNPQAASDAGNKAIKWRPNEKTRRFRYYDENGDIKHFSIHNPQYFNKNEREYEAHVNQRKLEDIKRRDYDDGGSVPKNAQKSSKIYPNKESADRAGEMWSKSEYTGPKENMVFQYYDENGDVQTTDTYASIKRYQNIKGENPPRGEKGGTTYEGGGMPSKDQMDAGEAEVTPGKFSHESNPIDLVQKNGEDGEPEKVGEMTGGEAIVPPKNVKQIRGMINRGDGKGLVRLMDRLLTKWDKEAAEDEESRAEFGKTMAKHGAVHKPRVPSGKQKFKFRNLGRSSIGKL